MKKTKYSFTLATFFIGLLSFGVGAYTIVGEEITDFIKALYSRGYFWVIATLFFFFLAMKSMISLIVNNSKHKSMLEIYEDEGKRRYSYKDLEVRDSAEHEINKTFELKKTNIEDYKQNISILQTNINRLLEQNDALRDKIEEQEKKLSAYKNFKDFIVYASDHLENKAEVEAKMAANLLDRGMRYASFGVGFYILVIVGLQIASWFTGWKPQYLYGMVSCSFLFVFIEVISGWFLRQYRSYSNSAGSLRKAKSVYDRYLLSYLAIKEFHPDDTMPNVDSNHLFDMLAKPVSWISSTEDERGNSNIAIDLVDALGRIAKSINIKTKQEKELS